MKEKNSVVLIKLDKSQIKNINILPILLSNLFYNNNLCFIVYKIANNNFKINLTNNNIKKQ